MRFWLAAILVAFLQLAGRASAEPPAWLKDAVVYGAVPALFGPHGLADVTRRLDAIAALGATVLWLSPITDAPPDDFGYAVIDAFRIRPSLGSDEDLRELVHAAHARGLRVILDMPLNDLSDQHPYYRDLVARGQQSPYRDFFARDADGDVAHYFDWTNLENLNYTAPEVRAYVMAAFAHWLRDFNVDGFRVDAAWGPRQRTPDFWPSWSAALRRIKPDILLLAEASEHDPYYAAAGFDVAYDWSDKLGEWAWQAAFDGAAPAPALRRALAGERHDLAIFRFLDNNDTGVRFVTRHGPAMMRVAAAMLLTLPGLPTLYMGEESGAQYEPYRQREPLASMEPDEFGEQLRRLVALRHREPALRSNRLTLVATSDDDAVLAYLRPGATQSDGVLVLLNYSARPVALSFAEPAPIAALLGAAADDLISGEHLTIDGAAPVIALAPLTARILRRAPAR